jgi:AAA+ superfamily predicted ATPase
MSDFVIMDNDTDLLQTHINNWNSYMTDVNNKLLNMWNFILYNDFSNKEINRLHNVIEDKEKMIKDIDMDYISLMKKVSRLENKIKELEEDKDDEPQAKRVKLVMVKPRLINSHYDEYVKKNGKYNFLPVKIRDKYISEVFSNMNTIYDIIELENHKNRFDFMKNKKFIKIYNLIPSLKELGAVIGMDNVKDSIFKSICYFIHGLQNDNELNHVMIMGPPGVGKTTIAKIIGKIYLALDFLDNDKFITATRSDLIAKYLGHTAIKTQKLIDSCEGGVMFIDEVYSLGNEEKRDSFAKECIDTINLNMTNGKKWLLIVGGYKEDIYKSFMAYNKGLERRFTVKLEINGYNEKELYDIFLKFVKDDNWNIECNCFDLFNANHKYFKFYGGDIMKIFKKAKEYYAIRLMKHSNINNKYILTRDDIVNSIDFFKDNIDVDKMDSHVLHSMYL